VTDTGIGQGVRGGEPEEAVTSFCVQIAQVGVDNVPTAAAIANAVADAVGVHIDTLPITAEKVLRALSAP
jgi:hypothetical protein